MQRGFYVNTGPSKSYIFSPPVKGEPIFGSYVLFGKSGNDMPQLAAYLEGKNNPANEPFALQEMHLRYLMSSTAEQPDNSGRTSTINIWLTILIAALAAAILS